MTTAVPMTVSPAERPVVSRRVSYRSTMTEGYLAYEVIARPALDAMIERNGQNWIVLDRVTGIHGVGREPSEAVQDFARALAEHFDVLSRQDDLSDDLRGQLAYLQLRLASSS